MRRCKHQDVAVFQWTGFSFQQTCNCGEHIRGADAVRCRGCREWLPLSPASDEDERVKIEISAVMLADERGAEGFGPDRFDYCPDTKSEDLCGWCEAHYLAHCIAGHDIDRLRRGK